MACVIDISVSLYTESCLNMKMLSYQNGDPHAEDKMVWRPSYL